MERKERTGPRVASVIIVMKNTEQPPYPLVTGGAVVSLEIVKLFGPVAVRNIGRIEAFDQECISILAISLAKVSLHGLPVEVFSNTAFKTAAIQCAFPLPSFGLIVDHGLGVLLYALRRGDAALNLNAFNLCAGGDLAELAMVPCSSRVRTASAYYKPYLPKMVEHTFNNVISSVAKVTFATNPIGVLWKILFPAQNTQRQITNLPVSHDLLLEITVIAEARLTLVILTGDVPKTEGNRPYSRANGEGAEEVNGVHCARSASFVVCCENSASIARSVLFDRGMPPLSRRDTVAWLTPSFSASSACVRPIALRVALMSISQLIA